MARESEQKSLHSDKVIVDYKVSNIAAAAAANSMGYCIPSMLGAKTPHPLGAHHNTKARGRGRKGKSKGSGNLSMPRVMDNKPYNIIQSLISGTLTSSVTNPTYSSFALVLASFDQYTNFTSTFDQYRIPLVEVTYVPTVNIITASTSYSGRFLSVVDYDDSNNLTSVQQAADYSNVKISEGFKVHKHTFVPHVALAAYSGSFTSYVNEPAPWIDATSTGVYHYGTKTAWEITGAVYTYQIQVKAWLQFRNVR